MRANLASLAKEVGVGDYGLYGNMTDGVALAQEGGRGGDPVWHKPKALCFIFVKNLVINQGYNTDLWSDKPCIDNPHILCLNLHCTPLLVSDFLESIKQLSFLQ